MNRVLLVAGFFVLIACQDQSSIRNDSRMNGLWMVQEVKVGNELMTPNGRWTRLGADSTQTSGNGWKQHSIGTWSFSEKDSALHIVNTNGLEDPNVDFKVWLESDTMYWERMEEGTNVRVKLKRSDLLPMTYSDQLLGLWELDSLSGENMFLNESGDQLFIRWDGRFMINTTNDRIHGVYNVHGHRSELELIPYRDGYPRSFWSVDIDKSRIEMSLLNENSEVTRSLKRVHTF